jgi:hypothetical protein
VRNGLICLSHQGGRKARLNAVHLKLQFKRKRGEKMLGEESDTKAQRNQIKIMPFIQTPLAQSERDRPKATTMYVYNMSLSLVAV